MRVSSLVLLTGLFNFPAAGVAQEPSLSLQQADAAYKSGQAALAGRDLNSALVDFEKVVRLAPQAEQGHSALGAVLLSLGQTPRSIRELEKALAMKPSDETAQLNLAVAYGQSGATARALPLFAKVEASANARKLALPPYVLAAHARALAGTQPTQAIHRMQGAVLAEPANAEYQDELGSLYARQAAWPDAEKHFIEAARLNPDLASAHLHLALSLQAESKPGALEELTRASQLAPEDLTANLELGKAFVARDKDSEAIPIFKHLLQVHPEATVAGYQLALALQRTGHAPESIPYFEAVIRAEPENPEALTNLGMALMQVQRAKDAIPHLQKAVQLTPEVAIAHQDLAAAYIQLNQLTDAVAQLRLALHLSPDAPQLHYNLGVALKMEDDAAGAIPELEIAGKQNPSAPEPPYLLGVLYMQTGRYADAARELDRSLRLQPDNGDGWATLGSVYAKLDNLSQATSALREAIRQLPRQPDPHLTLAAVLARQGNPAEAAAERKQAGELMRANMNRQRAEVATHSANSLLESGKLDDAIAQFKDALSYDANYAEAHNGLANALERHGDSAAAAAERQRAQELAGPARP